MLCSDLQGNPTHTASFILRMLMATQNSTQRFTAVSRPLTADGRHTKQ